ncbi:MAG: mercuric reductase [Trueperaceae bacterium]|nr:mercuric reductase [Trueperaceae bacterium]
MNPAFDDETNANVSAPASNGPASGAASDAPASDAAGLAPLEPEFERFDHLLVGTGQATATLISGLPDDETICVIEGDLVGGTCVNDGCTPTKTLVASAKVAHQARRGAEYGVRTGEVEIDFAAVMARMNEVRGDSREGLTSFLEGNERITLIRGWAAFEEAGVVRVGDRRIEGTNTYLNVGARARVLDVPGLDDVPWLDNTRLLELDELPGHLIVVGGSYVGLEMAQVFRRLGSKVTVLEAGPQLMAREDADIADTARGIFEAEGIEIVTDARMSSVARRDAGSGAGDGDGDGIEVVADLGGTSRTVHGSHLLLAVGRVPNSDRLNLEAAGIETDERGYIRVDDRCRTTADGVWALGDVNGQGAFTHTSVNDAEIVLDDLHGGSRRLSERDTIYAMFVDPPLGRVGMSEKEAKEKGHRVLKATMPMSKVSRAKEAGETEGMIKLLVDADTDRFLGVAVLGMHGDELANLFAAFMRTGADWHTFRRTVLVHPTVGELLPFVLDGLQPA